MSIITIIVDDEPVAREILRGFCERALGIALVGEGKNGREALDLAEKHRPDLVLLDINMPGLTGIELARMLDRDTCVVFTTGYPEFAVEGFELEAVDYLVKPISFERFIQAVGKVRKQLAGNRKAEDVIWIKADKRLHKVPLDQIRFIEGMGDYLKLRVGEDTLVTHETMKNMEELLPGERFLRIHKSYIVSLAAISYIEGNMVRVGEDLLPVGASYQERFRERFG